MFARRHVALELTFSTRLRTLFVPALLLTVFALLPAYSCRDSFADPVIRQCGIASDVQPLKPVAPLLGSITTAFPSVPHPPTQPSSQPTLPQTDWRALRSTFARVRPWYAALAFLIGMKPARTVAVCWEHSATRRIPGGTRTQVLRL